MNEAAEAAQRFRRGTIDALVLRVAGVGALFLMHTSLARLIGAQDYGVINYSLSLVGLLSVIVALGWPTAIMRFISQYSHSQEWGLLRGALVRAHQMTFMLSLLVSGCIAIIAYRIPAGGHLGKSLYFTTALLPIMAYIGLRRKAFQGLRRIKISIFLEDVTLPLLVLVAAYAFSISTAKQAFFVYFFASLIVLIVSAVWLIYSFPYQVRAAVPRFETRTWILITLPMVLGNIGQIVMSRSDVLILGLMQDMESVGIYSGANRIAMLNIFILGAINTIAAPMLASAYHSQSFDNFDRIARKTMVWSGIGALPVFLIMMVMPERILSFFGSEFVNGATVLRILATGQFVNAITGPVGFALLMTGREREYALSITIVAVCAVVAKFLVIPVAGMTGVAVVSAISVAVLNLWLFGVAKRISKQKNGA